MSRWLRDPCMIRFEAPTMKNPTLELAQGEKDDENPFTIAPLHLQANDPVITYPSNVIMGHQLPDFVVCNALTLWYDSCLFFKADTTMKARCYEQALRLHDPHIKNKY